MLFYFTFSMVHTVKKECEYCGKSYRRTWQNRRQKFCSKKCYGHSICKFVFNECKCCGIRFRIVPNRKNFALFCSRKCYLQYHKAVRKKCLFCNKSFIVHHCRKDKAEFCYVSCASTMHNIGRRKFDSKTYVEYCLKGNKIVEHRAIMESILGIKLKKKEIVHHINGIKSDNRPENLQVMTSSEHMSFHGKTRKRTKYRIKKFCERCNKEFSIIPHQYLKRFCSKHCYLECLRDGSFRKKPMLLKPKNHVKEGDI